MTVRKQPTPASDGRAPQAPPAGDASTVSRDGVASLEASLAIGETGGAQPPEAEVVEEEDLSFLTPPQAEGERGRLGGYRVLRVLGQGGMGMVLEAEDVRLKRRVALKVMRPEIAHRAANRARFLREAQAAAAIEHPHIVPIFQVGEENGVPFIAMPFLKGEPLDVRLKRERLGVPEILVIGRQVAEGLAVAHEQGMIHRDIKPANIWLEEIRHAEAGARQQANVRILDFGLARVENDDAKLTGSGAVMGTPAYMAPEQAMGHTVDHRADLFSFGVMLYEMATGQRPFRGANTMAILYSLATDTPPAPVGLNPELPPDLSRLIMKLLEKDPARRLGSAQEAATILRQLQPENVVVVVAKRESATEVSPWAGIDDSVPPPTASRRPESAATRANAKSSPQPKPKKAPSTCLVHKSPVGDCRCDCGHPWCERVGRPIAAWTWEVCTYGLGGAQEEPNVATVPKQELPKLNSSPRPVVKGDEMTFDLGKGVKLAVIKINATGKKFLMGSPNDEPGRNAIEDQHEISFKHNWYMGKYEITQEQYQAVMNDNPSQHKSAKNPVEMVTWNDAKTFCEKMTDKFKDQKLTFRLPSEAEWEYSCRAGTTTAYSFGKSLTTKQAAIWGSGGTKPVGSYEANAFGLSDMHGNVWEWCEDYYGPYDKAPTDGTAQLIKQSSHIRLLRGGAWDSLARDYRSAFRYTFSPGFRSDCHGFRLVVSSQDDEAKIDPSKKDDPKVIKKDDPPPQPVVKGGEMTFDLGNGVKLAVIKINAKGKKFLMGSPTDDPERDGNEEQHEVSFKHNWYMGKHEVTQEQYQAIMNDNPSHFKGDKKPVEKVTWNEAKQFCDKMTDKFKEQKLTFRLPSEAEWEYSCRAGTTTAYSFGKSLTQQQAHFGFGDGTKPVGSYEANAFGLFDMHGNVWEWCEDYYGPYDKAPTDGTAQLIKQTSDVRVLRGGCWINIAGYCRSAFRYNDIPGIRYGSYGFRLAVASQD